MEVRLKDTQEDADKEKALKQVAEADLKDKVLALNVMERRAITAKTALDQAKQKAIDALNKLREAELKLAQIASVLSARDKEFADFKAEEKDQKQHYYNKGFKHTEDLANSVVFQSRKFGFM